MNLSSAFGLLANGVISAAFLVSMTASPWPDIAIAAVIAFLFIRSAMRVTREALPQFRATAAAPAE